MNRTCRITLAASAVAMLLAQAACSSMTEQQKSTAIGAGAGALGGAAVTGGSTTGTLGGAAIGGIIGHEVGKPDK